MSQALVSLFHDPGRPMELASVPVPTPEPDHALVRVTLATICGSDLHTVSGRRDAPAPCILGHEGVGRVAEANGLSAADGRPLAAGDRVTWSLMSSCGECPYCTKRRLPQKCDHLGKYGHARYEDAHDLNGCFAEYILLRPGTRVHHVPDVVTDEEAVPLNCAGATIVGGLEAVGTREGESAVVLGSGMLGLYAAARLRTLGYETVAVVDRLEPRLRLAREFGATDTFQVGDMEDGAIGEALTDLTQGRGPDLAIEASGAPAALASAVEWLGVGGR
ncbi:alcohol dehydrogenase catalytic domain-containing protein, partial [Candidatus Poribacteria bacterium]|nr:alcohol dehydrogenase catalytic domain-containing protein [Candidatus Poribacteria bacterium]